MIFNRRKANKDELSSTGKGIPRENSVAVGTAVIAGYYIATLAK